MNDTPEPPRTGEVTGTPRVPPTRVTGCAPGAGLLPGIRDYVVIRKIGVGGMGAVFLAEDAKLRRQVAIKVMRPELAADQTHRERFEREARAAAAVESDYIVPILHVGEAADGTPFIVMPFLQGETLDSRLKREPVTPMGLVLKVAREVADGLAAAHAKGLIHRDVKPGNVWLEGDPSARELARQIHRCKILDFGLARTSDKDEARITVSGAVLGTPAFMSPEQARGQKVDHRADLFSLGAMLYRMATGKLPFDAPTPMAVLIAITTEPHVPAGTRAAHVPPALADLIDRLMDKDPAGRPRSATEVSAAARQIARDLKAKRTTPEPLAPTARSPVPPPRPRALLGASAVEVGPVEPLELPDGDDTETDPDPARRAVSPWRRTALLGAIGLLALVLVGSWLAGTFGSKKRDPGAERREEPDRTEGPKDPTPEPHAPPDPSKDGEITADPDRRAALFVLSVGGQLRVDDDERDITDPKDLPKGSFRLTCVRKNSTGRINNTSVAVFKDCKHLERIDFGDTKMGDEGLAALSGCSNLQYLDVGNTRVSDAGLATIRRFTKLTNLELGGLPEVTEKGVTDLAKALTRCEIRWDGGRTYPKK